MNASIKEPPARRFGVYPGRGFDESPKRGKKRPNAGGRGHCPRICGRASQMLLPRCARVSSIGREDTNKQGRPAVEAWLKHFLALYTGSENPNEVPELSARESHRSEVLRGMRDAAGAYLCQLQDRPWCIGKVLHQLCSSGDGCGGFVRSLRLAGTLYAEASGRADSDLEGSPGRRTQASDRVVCGPEGLDGV